MNPGQFTPMIANPPPQARPGPDTTATATAAEPTPTPRRPAGPQAGRGGPRHVQSAPRRWSRPPRPEDGHMLVEERAVGVAPATWAWPTGWSTADGRPWRW